MQHVLNIYAHYCDRIFCRGKHILLGEITDSLTTTVHLFEMNLLLT